MIKLRRWLNRLSNRTPIGGYRTLASSLSSINSAPTGGFEYCSVENLYEDIKKFGGTDLRDHVAYNLYLRQYFFALRDSRLNGRRSNDEMVCDPSAGDNEDAEYRFGEDELLKQSRGRLCSSNLPRICVCSCEMTRRTTPPTSSPGFESWDAGWVFQAGDREIRKLARRSRERVKDRLFDDG
nr:uncharacterized protein LOC109408801 [Aedes albopictus]XP_029729309.1 uncharacterized protein LOC115266842 [Aedes albopictus]